MSPEKAREGRLLVRWWFPAARTPGCVRQAQALRAAWSALGDLGVDVVGLSFDSPTTLAEWRAELALPFTLRHASISDAARFGALREVGDPWRSTQAARVATIVDDRGEVLRHWTVKDPDRFADELREALDGLTTTTGG